MTQIEDIVKKALADNPGAKIEIIADKEGPQPPPPVVVPPHVAANIVKMLGRVQMTGPEAIAWVEAVQLMQQIGAPFLQSQNGNPTQGVPFMGLGK